MSDVSSTNPSVFSDSSPTSSQNFNVLSVIATISNQYDMIEDQLEDYEGMVDYDNYMSEAYDSAQEALDSCSSNGTSSCDTSTAMVTYTDPNTGEAVTCTLQSFCSSFGIDLSSTNLSSSDVETMLTTLSDDADDYSSTSETDSQYMQYYLDISQSDLDTMSSVDETVSQTDQTIAQDM